MSLPVTEFLPTTLLGWETVLVQAGAAFAVLFALFKWIIPRCVRAWRMLSNIEAQLIPNGGKSARDALDRLERLMVELADGLDMADARQWAVISAGPTPTWESDEVGSLLRANASFLQLLGRSQDEMLGNGWQVALLRSDAKRVWVEWQDAVAQRRTFESSYTVVHASGQKYKVHAKAMPILNRRHELRGWMGIYTSVEKLP